MHFEGDLGKIIKPQEERARTLLTPILRECKMM